MKKLSVLILSTIFTASVLQADTMVTQPKATPSLKATEDKEWTLELGSGLYISDVRTDLPGYTLVPAELMASIRVDDVGLDDFWGGALRGNTEFFFVGSGVAVVHGTESRFVGLRMGPRYNFVQKGWPVVPFVEGSIGFAFNDSQGVTLARGQVGQGQDFSFQFGIAGGIRYDLTESWFLRLTAEYTHYSNAGLSEPGRKNRALDAAGPLLGMGYRF